MSRRRLPPLARLQLASSQDLNLIIPAERNLGAPLVNRLGSNLQRLGQCRDTAEMLNRVLGFHHRY